jgi:DNA invertase Pin-like site-specific DNA recombinase
MSDAPPRFGAELERIFHEMPSHGTPLTLSSAGTRAVSQYEQAMIALRLRAGRERKAAKGDYAGGQLPYGYRAVGRELIPDETEQATIRRIRELHSLGSSLRSIAVQLECEGLNPRRGSVWQAGTLAGIVNRVAA